MMLDMMLIPLATVNYKEMYVDECWGDTVRLSLGIPEVRGCIAGHRCWTGWALSVGRGVLPAPFSAARVCQGVKPAGWILQRPE